MKPASISGTPRRSFISRISAAAAALALGGRSARAQVATDRARGSLATPAEFEEAERRSFALHSQAGEPWLAALHGSRRQLFDAVTINDGYVLRFASTWTRTMREAYALSADDVCALLVMRHHGIAPAFNDSVWEKYRLGALFEVQDPKTKAPALRNIYNSTQEGDWSQPSAAVSRMVEGGAVVAVCGAATLVYAGRAARAAGLTISAQDAYRDFADGLLPGCHLAPSGVLAVHRAQAAGQCTYCYSG